MEQTSIYSWSRLFFLLRNRQWLVLSWKSVITSPLTVRPVCLVLAMTFTMYLRKWSSTRDIQSQILTRSVELLPLPMEKQSKPVRFPVMCPSQICVEFRFVRLFFLILRRKKSCSTWELSHFLYSLLMRLPSIVNMMLMVMKCLENMDRCLSRNI